MKLNLFGLILVTEIFKVYGYFSALNVVSILPEFIDLLNQDSLLVSVIKVTSWQPRERPMRINTLAVNCCRIYLLYKCSMLQFSE